MKFEVYRLPMGWYWIVKPTFANSLAHGPFLTAEAARADAAQHMRNYAHS